jgi:hypothetical protein
MALARPLSAADHEDLLDTDGFPDWDYMPGEDGQPFEFKASDWGRLKGRWSPSIIRPRRMTLRRSFPS